MSNFNTFTVDSLKWFVYVGTGHVGPLTATELREGFLAKTYTPSHYVWSQVMKDWQPIQAIPELLTYLNDVPGLSPPPLTLDAPHETHHDTPSETPQQSSEIQISEIEIDPPQEPEHVPAPETEKELSSPIIPNSPEDASETKTTFFPEKNQETESPSLTNISPASEEKKIHAFQLNPVDPQKNQSSHRKKILGAAFITLGIIFVGLAGYYWWTKSKTAQPAVATQTASAIAPTPSFNLEDLKLKLVQKIPLLAKWISPIPQITDLGTADVERLKQAILQPLESGVQVEIALSSLNSSKPSFYIASNLPNKTELTIHFLADPESLLGAFGFQKSIPAILQNGIAKTSQLTHTNGGPLLPGEYAVLVTESSNQPEEVKLKLAGLKSTAIPGTFSNKPYLAAHAQELNISDKKSFGLLFTFLGGTKDSTYESRLKEFHDGFKTKFDTEMQEFKQTISFLTSQWVDTKTKYQQLKAQRSTKNGQKLWSKFHSTWMQMDQQIKTKLAAPSAASPGQLGESLFPETRKLILQFATSISTLHETQNGYFIGQTPLPKTEELLTELYQKAEANQKAVTQKIDQIEAAGSSPSGLPILPPGA